MEKTLLVEADCFDGEGKVRIYKTEDGKFFCEQISRSATFDSEIDVVKFCDVGGYDPLHAAGISRAAYDLVSFQEDEDFRRFTVRRGFEKLNNEMKSLMDSLA